MLRTKDGYKYANVSDIDITGNIIPVQEMAGNVTRNPLMAEDFAFLQEFLFRVPRRPSTGPFASWPKDLDASRVQDLVDGFARLSEGSTIYSRYKNLHGRYINVSAGVSDEFKVVEIKDSVMPSDEDVLLSFYTNTEINRRSTKYANGNLPAGLKIDVMRSMYDDIRLFKRFIGANYEGHKGEGDTCLFSLTARASDWADGGTKHSGSYTSQGLEYVYGDYFSVKVPGRPTSTDFPCQMFPMFEKSWWDGGMNWFMNQQIEVDFTYFRLAIGDTNVTSYKALLKWEVRASGAVENPGRYYVYKIINCDKDVDNFAQIKSVEYLSSGMCRDVLRLCGINPDQVPSKDDPATVISCRLVEVYCCDVKFTHDTNNSPEVESLGWTY